MQILLFSIAVVVTAVALTALYEWFRRTEQKKNRPVPNKPADQPGASILLPGVYADWDGAKDAVGLQRANAEKPQPAIQRFEERQQPGIVFRDSKGIPLPTRKAWGDIPYEELGPMFLDQFLLRYFAPWMCRSGLSAADALSPWDAFAYANPWVKEMPLLFEQLTGYKLNDMQLNNAVVEYARRVLNAQRAATPVQRETENAEYTPDSRDRLTPGGL
jgi:hypothetical protein